MTASLARILLQSGLLDALWLGQATTIANAAEVPLAHALTRWRLLRSDDLARVLSQSLSMPIFDLDAWPGPPAIPMPRAACRQLRVLPIALEKKELALAMADPTDLDSAVRIESKLGVLVRRVLINDDALERALFRFFPRPVDALLEGDAAAPAAGAGAGGVSGGPPTTVVAPAPRAPSLEPLAAPPGTSPWSEFAPSQHASLAVDIPRQATVPLPPPKDNVPPPRLDLNTTSSDGWELPIGKAPPASPAEAQPSPSTAPSPSPAASLPSVTAPVPAAPRSGASGVGELMPELFVDAAASLPTLQVQPIESGESGVFTSETIDTSIPGLEEQRQQARRRAPEKPGAPEATRIVPAPVSALAAPGAEEFHVPTEPTPKPAGPPPPAVSSSDAAPTKPSIPAARDVAAAKPAPAKPDPPASWGKPIPAAPKILDESRHEQRSARHEQQSARHEQQSARLEQQMPAPQPPPASRHEQSSTKLARPESKAPRGASPPTVAATPSAKEAALGDHDGEERTVPIPSLRDMLAAAPAAQPGPAELEPAPTLHNDVLALMRVLVLIDPSDAALALQRAVRPRVRELAVAPLADALQDDARRFDAVIVVDPPNTQRTRDHVAELAARARNGLTVLTSGAEYARVPGVRGTVMPPREPAELVNVVERVLSQVGRSALA